MVSIRPCFYGSLRFQYEPLSLKLSKTDGDWLNSIGEATEDNAQVGGAAAI